MPTYISIDNGKEYRGEWAINDDVIEIRCNNNPVLSDVEKALEKLY